MTEMSVNDDDRVADERGPGLGRGPATAEKIANPETTEGGVSWAVNEDAGSRYTIAEIEAFKAEANAAIAHERARAEQAEAERDALREAVNSARIIEHSPGLTLLDSGSWSGITLAATTPGEPPTCPTCGRAFADGPDERVGRASFRCLDPRHHSATPGEPRSTIGQHRPGDGQ